MEFEGRSRIRNQLDIAPLVDVVFLLLVFFMLTSTFSRPEAIEVVLPEADSGETVDETPIEVVLDRDGGVRRGGAAVTLEELQAGITARLAEDAERAIGVTADAEASVRQMMDVIDRVRLGGGRNLAFATRPRTSATEP
jgi:biopolymer transport protein ExbD